MSVYYTRPLFAGLDDAARTNPSDEEIQKKVDDWLVHVHQVAQGKALSRLARKQRRLQARKAASGEREHSTRGC